MSDDGQSPRTSRTSYIYDENGRKKSAAGSGSAGIRGSLHELLNHSEDAASKRKAKVSLELAELMLGHPLPTSPISELDHDHDHDHDYESQDPEDPGMEELNKKGRLELIRLHRRYRLLERQRHTLTQEGGASNSAQRRIVHILKNEKDDLNANLHNAVCAQYKRNARRAELTILEFVRRYEDYKSQILQLIADAKEVESHGDKIQHRVVKLRIKILAWLGMQKTPEEFERVLHHREHVLYTVTTQFNLKCKENEALRERIDNTLRERSRFYKRSAYLRDEIMAARNQMAELVHYATLTYESRDEAAAKIKAIRERDLRDSRLHLVDIKEYQMLLHHDKRLHDFLRIKNKPRGLLEGDEDKLVRKTRAKELALDNILSGYHDAIKKILTLSSTRTTDALYRRFQALEQDNMKVFKSVTTMNDKMDFLKRNVEGVLGRIDALRAEGKRRKAELRKMLAKEQKGILGKEETLQKLYSSLEVNQARLKLLLNALLLFFKTGKCPTKTLQWKLGNDIRITGKTAYLYMDLIKERLTELQELMPDMKEDMNKAGVHFVSRSKTMAKGSSIHGAHHFIGSSLKLPHRECGAPFKADVFIPHRLTESQEESQEGDHAERVLYQGPQYIEEMREILHPVLVEQGMIQNRRSEGPEEVPSVTPSFEKVEDIVLNPVQEDFFGEVETVPSNYTAVLRVPTVRAYSANRVPYQSSASASSYLPELFVGGGQSRSAADVRREEEDDDDDGFLDIKESRSMISIQASFVVHDILDLPDDPFPREETAFTPGTGDGEEEQESEDSDSFDEAPAPGDGENEFDYNYDYNE